MHEYPVLMKIAQAMSVAVGNHNAYNDMATAMYIALSLAFEYPEYARALFTEAQAYGGLNIATLATETAIETVELFPIEVVR